MGWLWSTKIACMSQVVWWRNASQIAAEVLRSVFCSGAECRPETAERWMHSREAPAAGIALRVVRESEQVVAAGTPLLEIGDLEDLEVEVDFLSEVVARMRVGMPVEIFGRAVGDPPLQGTIRRIYPSAFTKISSLGVEQQRVNVITSLAEPRAVLGDLYRVEVRVILIETEGRGGADAPRR